MTGFSPSVIVTLPELAAAGSTLIHASSTAISGKIEAPLEATKLTK